MRPSSRARCSKRVIGRHDGLSIGPPRRTRIGVTHRTDLSRVIVGVRGEMKRAAGAQQRDQSRDDIGTNESAAPLLSLRPRVREENANRGERVRRNAADEIDHITVDDANIA